MSNKLLHYFLGNPRSFKLIAIKSMWGSPFLPPGWKNIHFN
jgi:hypothetical protein